MKIGIIGVGNMGGAIAQGLINSENFDNNDLYLYNRTFSKIKRFEGEAHVCESIEELLINVQVIILAIKPNEYKEWLTQYSEVIQDKLLISIAAGISNKFLRNYTSMFVVSMPNMGSKINIGYTVVCRNRLVEEALENIILEEALKLFAHVGRIKVIEEEDIEMYIGMLGSSPAYFFEIVRSMSKYFLREDIEQEVLENDLAYIMQMSASMIMDSNVSCDELVDSVCSKGGATIEAIDSFREDRLDGTFARGIDKCVNKANKMKEDSHN